MSEVEILAATLEEPSRALIRAALIAQRQGRLDAAARVSADQVAKRPALRWAALLLALEAAELRLAGSVAYATPRSRFAASDSFPLFEERWGAFGCTVFPDGHQVRLELLPAGPSARHSYVLRAHPSTEEAAQATGVAEAITTLIHELESYLGVGVRLEEELRACEDGDAAEDAEGGEGPF